MDTDIKIIEGNQNSNNAGGGGVPAKIAAVIEIIIGTVFALMSLYGFIMKTESRDIIASFWMLLFGASLLVAGIFLFRLNRWAWIASMVFYGGGMIFLIVDTLIEHFGHGVVMAVAFNAGIIPCTLMAALLVVSFRAVFARNVSFLD